MFGLGSTDCLVIFDGSANRVFQCRSLLFLLLLRDEYSYIYNQTYLQLTHGVQIIIHLHIILVLLSNEIF